MSRLARLLSRRMSMLREDAQAVAAVVEQAFAGKPELDDELLGKDLRQVFYDLQDRQVLDLRREERRTDGAARRHYLWRIHEDDPRVPDPAPAPDAATLLYSHLKDAAWARRPPGRFSDPP